MNKRFIVAAILSLNLFTFTSCVVNRLPETDCTQAQNVVKSFYSRHFDDDFGFTRKSIEGKAIFFTPEFNALLKRELDREDDFKKQSPNEVPFISGDVFTDSQEYPTSFRVGNCKTSGENGANIDVSLLWKLQNGYDQKELKVVTKKQNDKWLIDDVLSNQDNAQESLKATLSREQYQK